MVDRNTPDPDARPRTGSVLILGNFRPTTVLARRYKDLGYDVVITRGGGGTAQYSRYVDECWDHPEPIESAVFVDALAALLWQRPDIGIVVPLTEPAVLAVARFRDRLPRDRVYATPDDETVLTCLDKVAMLKVCEATGVPSVPAEVVGDLAELGAAADRIGFPLVVRPLSSSLPIAGRKAFIARGPSDLARLNEAWPEGHDRLIVQSFVDGPRYNVDFVAQNGEPLRMVATRILRTNALDGTGIDVCGVTEPLPADLEDYTRRMMRHFDYTGVGLIQFMVDRARGQVSFLELNPRFNGNSKVPDAHGLDFPRLCIDLARDPRRSEPPLTHTGGLRHVWTFGDLSGIRASRRQGMIGWPQVPGAVLRTLVDALRADYTVMWDWRDPWPALMQVLRKLPAPLTRHEHATHLASASDVPALVGPVDLDLGRGVAHR